MEISFLLSDGLTILKDRSSILQFTGVFNAPLSTREIAPFKIVIKDKDNAVLAEDDGKIVLKNLQPNILQTSSISQVNSVTVGAPTAVYFTVTSLNPIPVDGGV